MSWSTATTTRDCNRCRRVLAFGDRVWRGEHTPAVWCEPCAGEAGLDGQPGVDDVALPDGLDKRKLAAAFPEFTEAMRKLKAMAAGKGRRDVSMRIVGERE